MSWQPADENFVRRLSERFGEGWAGFDGGDLPDSIWILHAMYEQFGGPPYSNMMWTGDLPVVEGRLRRVRWGEYAQRHGVPVVIPGRGPGIHGALPGLWQREEFHVPSEGSLDRQSWIALAEHLIAVSPDGAETACGAFFTTPFGDSQYAAFSGVLDEVVSLLDLDVDDSNGPQNVWDFAETWIVYTDYDGWATRVSGPTDLISRLLDDERLDTDRLPDVPSTNSLS